MARKIKQNNLKLMIVIILVVLSVPVSAQTMSTENTTKVRHMGLEKCIQTGLSSGSEIEESRLKVRELEARRAQARLSRIGSIELSGSYTRLSEVEGGSIDLPASLGQHLGVQSIEFEGGDTDAASLSLKAQQPLFTGFRISTGIAQADLAVHSSREAYRKAQQSTRFQVAQAFWALVEATEAVRVMEKSVERAEALLKEVQNRSAQGMTTREDVLRVEMSLEQARVQFLETTYTRELAHLHLRLLLSLPEHEKIAPEYDFSDSFEVPQQYSIERYERILSRALQQRPEVKINHLQHEITDAELRSVSGKWLPSVSLFGQVDYANPNSRQFPPEDEFLMSWQVGLIGSINIADYTKIRPEKKAATQALRQIEQQDEQLIRKISLQIKQDLLNLHQAERRLQAAEKIREQARENYRIVYDKYLSGLAVNSDVVRAQEKLLEAQLSRSRAHIACRKGISKLQLDTGTDIGSDENG